MHCWRSVWVYRWKMHFCQRKSIRPGHVQWETLRPGPRKQFLHFPCHWARMCCRRTNAYRRWNDDYCCRGIGGASDFFWFGFWLCLPSTIANSKGIAQNCDRSCRLCTFYLTSLIVIFTLSFMFRDSPKDSLQLKSPPTWKNISDPQCTLRDSRWKVF